MGERMEERMYMWGRNTERESGIDYTNANPFAILSRVYRTEGDVLFRPS